MARLRKAEVSIPGGCVIGPRPIDLHLKGLAKLNCEVAVSGGYVSVDASNMRGGPIFWVAAAAPPSPALQTSSWRRYWPRGDPDRVRSL